MAEIPVDIRQLAGILGKSKSVLDKVESQIGPSGDGGSYSQKSISENRTAPLPNGMVDSSEMLTSLPAGKTPSISSALPRQIQHTLKNAKTTRMPKEIVEAMINNPIGSSTQNLMDVDPEIVNMINPKGRQKKQKTIKEETTQSGSGSFNRTELKSLIKEVVGEVLIEREVDEQVQIRVGDTIFTGKITKSKSINK